MKGKVWSGIKAIDRTFKITVSIHQKEIKWLTHEQLCPQDGQVLPKPYTKYILTSEQASTQTLKMLKIKKHNKNNNRCIRHIHVITSQNFYRMRPNCSIICNVVIRVFVR